jgi:filamentous hemagglutinin family protein
VGFLRENGRFQLFGFMQNAWLNGRFVMAGQSSLNHIYRTVWNEALGVMVAVAEIAPSHQGGGASGVVGAKASAPLFTWARLGQLALAVAMAWGLAPHAQANPTGGVAIHGQAAMTTNGNQLTVTTQNGAGTSHSAINWQSFSIPTGSTTQIVQPSAASMSINRVVTNTPSQLFGTLSSNGQVVLVNQAGIAVGAGAFVDTAGFTASAVGMTAQDAMAGRLRFGGDGLTNTIGALMVQGNIIARGGDVVLIAPSIELAQTAVVEAQGGSVMLAAGQSVEVTGRGLEGISMQVQAPSDQAINLGMLKGDAVGIFAGTLKHSGLIQATQAALEGGKVVLKASGDAYVEGNGRIDATSSIGKGGSIHVLGQRVAVTDNATLDASGKTGGGSVLVGGDYQGKNSGVQNAEISYLGSGATLKADGLDNGDGGKVIVWADDTTRAYGSISARGGANGGDGGFIETSGKRVLEVSGIRADASAAAGAGGQWLLDPTDISITSGAGSFQTGPTFVFNPGTSSSITDGTINATLSGGTDVTLKTVAGTGNGDILFNTGVSISSGASTGRKLRLEAHRNIELQGTIATTSVGSLTVEMLPNQSAGGGRVHVASGTTFALNGAGGSLIAEVQNGTTWDNDGTITLSGAQAKIHLHDGFNAATFNNLSSGVVNINSGGSAQAIYSNGTSDGVITNAGTINVGANTAFHAKYSQTGALNIKDATLELKNANTISGTIDLAPAGSGTPSTLKITENRGNTAAFSNVNIVSTNASVTNQTNVLIGGSLGAVTDAVAATFDNVDALNTIFTVDGTAGNVASVKFNGGNSGIFGFVKGTNGTVEINNANVGIASPNNVPLNANVILTGNVGVFAVGNLTVDAARSHTGNLKLIAGWNKSISAPAQDGTSNTLLAINAPLTVSGSLDLISSGDVNQNSAGGSPIVAGATTISAPQGSVTLTDSNNDFLSIAATSGGYSGSISLADVNALALNAISSAGGSVTITAGGAITQSSGGINTTRTGGSGGAVTVNGTSVALGSITSTGAEFTGDGNIAQPGGNILVQATAGGVSVGAIDARGSPGSTDSFSGNGTNGGNGGVVTISATAGVTLTSINVGGGIAGAGTISGAAGVDGKWLVYAASPSVVSKGSMTASNFRHYNATYSNYASPTESGNGFIYASAAPTGPININTFLNSGTASNVYGAAPTATYGYTVATAEIDSEDITGTALFTPISSTTAAGSYTVKYVSGLTANAAALSGSATSATFTWGAIEGTGTSVAYTVDKAALTVTANSDSTKVYSGVSQSVSGFTAIGLVNGESATVLTGVTGASASGINAGSYNTALAGTDSNYNLSFVNGALVIAKADAVVTANSDTSKVYSGLAQSVSGFTASGLVNSETTSVLAGVTSGASGINAGSYTATAGVGTYNGNYTLSFVNGNLTIAKADAVVTSNSDTSKVYSGLAQSVSGFTATGLVNSETTSVLAGVTSGASGTNAGSYTATAGVGTYNGNYTLSFVNGNLTIAKANAVVTANSDTSKVYSGLAQSVSGFTASGLVNSETTSVLAGVTSGASGINSGSYTATAGVGTYNGNYTLSFVNGNLVIAAAPVSFTGTRTYDGTLNFAASSFGTAGTISTGIGSETVVLSGSGTVASKNVAAGAQSVSVAGLSLGNGATGLASNYTFTGGTATGTIAVRPQSTWTGAVNNLWSNQGNWDALPDGNNVLVVSIPAGKTAVFDNSVAATTLQSIASAGTLSVQSGTLTVSSGLVTSGYEQAGGAVGGGSLTVNGSFSQTGGSIAMASINIASASIAQTGGGMTTAALTTSSTAGTSLKGSNNNISSWNASNQGSGNIELSNKVVINLLAINNNGNNIAVDNIGGITTSGLISAPSGSVTIVANSPLTIGAAGVAAGGNITLQATNLTSSGDMVLNGPIVSTSGSVALSAASNLTQNSDVQAALGVTATSGGTMSFGPLATSSGNPLSYSVGSTPVNAPPPPSSQLVATNQVVALMAIDNSGTQLTDDIPAAADPSASTDASDEDRETNTDTLVAEAEICKP